MISPIGMTLRDWADSIVSDFNNPWAFGVLEDETRWQEWAVGFVRAPDFAQRILPDPYAFADWREWAMRAYPMLEEVS